MRRLHLMILRHHRRVRRRIGGLCRGVFFSCLGLWLFIRKRASECHPPSNRDAQPF